MVAKNSKALVRAKSMRKAPSEAERRLWNCLRNRTLNNLKFSRQVPIGIYIADFVCRERKYILEIDGVTHGDAHEILRDEKRTAFLKSQGYIVHRVWNDDIYKNLTGVVDSILLALDIPSPASQRRGTLSPEG